MLLEITDMLLCRRIAKSTGATVVSTLADLDGNESFDASSLGTAEEVRLHETMFSTRMTFIHIHLANLAWLQPL